MDTKEKLVELIESARYWGSGTSEEIADHIIRNGVTVQEWIPLSEQKPNRDDLVLVFFEGMRDTPIAIQIMYGWCIVGSASHWMPLPQPPKGE